MRYGIVFAGDGLPPSTLQRVGFTEAGCQFIIEDIRADQKRIDALLKRLRKTDEILVYSLMAFQRSTGELAHLLRQLIGGGILIRLPCADNMFATTLGPRSGPEVIDLIDLLAEHEDGRRSHASRGHRGGSRNPLSRFQINYARNLYRRGTPLRTIGMIFQLPPDDLWRLIGEPRAAVKPASSPSASRSN